MRFFSWILTFIMYYFFKTWTNNLISQRLSLLTCKMEIIFSRVVVWGLNAPIHVKCLVYVLAHDVHVCLRVYDWSPLCIFYFLSVLHPPHQHFKQFRAGQKSATGLKIILLFLQRLKPSENLGFEGSRKWGRGRGGGRGCNLKTEIDCLEKT